MTEVKEALEFQKKELFFWFDGQMKMKDKTIAKLKQQIQDMREQHEKEVGGLRKELKESHAILKDTKEEHQESTARLLKKQKTYEDGIRAITKEFRAWAQMRDAAQKDWAAMVMNYNPPAQSASETPSLSTPGSSPGSLTPKTPSPPTHNPFRADHQHHPTRHSGSSLRLAHPPAGSGRRAAQVPNGKTSPPNEPGSDSKVGGYARRRYSARRARRPPRQPRRPLTEPHDDAEEDAGGFLAGEIGEEDALPATPSGQGQVT
uniref:Uncharacterized protein n=1 Tax=Lotharella oceanica TaxID=641309 RepID=A0A7S2U2V9_9EUKA|mmetsp:Transcript_7614/g.14913  ORF Transcript_7614/g.14913 Transcript_7614/m.14913 type:complete len:261 (+) Transcript_7614:57-839(+)